MWRRGEWGRGGKGEWAIPSGHHDALHHSWRTRARSYHPPRATSPPSHHLPHPRRTPRALRQRSRSRPRVRLPAPPGAPSGGQHRLAILGVPQCACDKVHWSGREARASAGSRCCSPLHDRWRAGRPCPASGSRRAQWWHGMVWRRNGPARTEPTTRWHLFLPNCRRVVPLPHATREYR